MNDLSLGVVLTTLVIQNFACIVSVGYLVAKYRSAVVFRTILIIVYWTSIPLSGVAHIANPSRGSGFYDMFDSIDAYRSIYQAAITSTFATIAICAVALLAPPTRARHTSGYSNPVSSTRGGWEYTKRQAIYGTVLLVPSILGLAQIRRYAEESGAARVTSISDGTAKYAFMSHWFAWAISLLVLAALVAMPSRNRWIRITIILVGIAAIAWSLSWSGGRSVVIIMALPLILCASEILGRNSRYLYGPLALIFLSVLIENADARSQGYQNRDAFSILSLLDWQWGRFSMLGFSQTYTQENGFLLGETLVAGVWSVPLAILKILGLNLENGPRLSTTLTGEQLLGDGRQTYIVPGLPAEFYMNFGIPGVVVGIVVIAWLVCAAERKYQESATVTKKLAWAYIATCLIFCTIPAHSASVFNYVLFSGAPLLLLLVIREGRPEQNPRRKQEKLQVEHARRPLSIGDEKLDVKGAKV